MQQFRISPERFREIKKQMLLRSVPMLVIAAVGGITLATLNSKAATDAEGPNTLLFVIPVVIIVMGFGIYSAVKRNIALLSTYLITLTDNMIVREQMNTPTLEFYFRDIAAIVKQKNGYLKIKSSEGQAILIPPQLENYSRLEEILNGIVKIDERESRPLLEKYSILVSVLALGAMICVFTVMNKILVAVSGLLVTGLLTYSLWEIQRNKNIDNNLKRRSWIVLIVLGSVIGVMILKLSA